MVLPTKLRLREQEITHIFHTFYFHFKIVGYPASRSRVFYNYCKNRKRDAGSLVILRSVKKNFSLRLFSASVKQLYSCNFIEVLIRIRLSSNPWVKKVQSLKTWPFVSRFYSYFTELSSAVG